MSRAPILRLFLKVLFLLSFFNQIIQPARAREVRVCVLNDSVSPVESEVIDNLLRYASREYAREVGISFERVERHSFPLNVFLEDQDQFRKIRESCRNSEIAVVFSAQMIRSADWYSKGEGRAEPRGTSPYLLGLANSLGYAILTSIPHGLSTLDAAGKPKSYGTMLHEIGHLFFEGHLDDQRSFLHRFGSGKNEWTPETKWVIRQRCLREWELEPSVIHLKGEDLLKK